MSDKIQISKIDAKHYIDAYNALEHLRSKSYIDYETDCQIKQKILFEIVGKFAILLEKDKENKKDD